MKNKKTIFEIIIFSLAIPICILLLCAFLANNLKLESANKRLFIAITFIILVSIYIVIFQKISLARDFKKFSNKIQVNKLYLFLFIFNKKILSGYNLIKFPQILMVDYLGKSSGQSLIIIKIKKRISTQQIIYLRSERNKKIDVERIINDFNNEIFQSDNIKMEFIYKVANLFHVNYIELKKHKMIISVIKGYLNDEDKNKFILKLEEIGFFLNNYGII